MKTSRNFLISTDEKENLVLIDKDTGKKFVFYTAEAAWAFLQAGNDNTTNHKSS